MAATIKGKNSILIISVLAWGLALFFTAKLASGETGRAHQDPPVGWYETEDALPGMHHNKTEKMMRQSESTQVTTGNDLVGSWYETEDALPYAEMQTSPPVAQKERVEQQVNTVEDLDQYSWFATDDALPQIQ